MARTNNNSPNQETWKDDHEEEEEEDEEALSLSDLPLLNSISLEDQNHVKTHDDGSELQNEEEFNFSSWGGNNNSLSTESEMCVADEVFFKGQILPLRLSVSSDTALIRRNNSGSLTSNVSSSRSSSSRSCTSTNSTTTTTKNLNPNSKPRIRNQFHTFPSPKPQIIRFSSARLSNGNTSGSRRSQKYSSVWDLFKLGLVRAPEIELQDLKARNNNISRNSSSGSSSNNSSSSNVKNYINKRQKGGGSRGGLFSDCKCSISAVETVPLNNIVIFKSGERIKNQNAIDEVEKKMQELKIKKRKMMKEKQQQGKQALSRHRTFEWLKELSHATYVDETLV